MATITSMTGTQFDALPYNEGRRWELLDGALIPVPSPTWEHQDIVFEILLAIRRHLEGNNVAGLAGSDVEFALSADDRLRPDVCVLLRDKASRLDRHKVPIPGAPDIAIEVISPSETASKSHDKVRAYLRNGTSEVWQVYPESRSVQIHHGETARTVEWTQPIETALLPGFSLQLASLFA